MDIDFEFWLLTITVVLGAVWGAYALFCLYLAKYKSTADEPKAEPILVEYARSFFPVLLAVLLLRGFLIEPFRIPSGSMIPTLLVGDFILVNKFAYGVRVPVTHQKLLDIGSPERGDVVVFRFPQNTGIDYIKRVVGLPGDIISYHDKVISVNGEPVELKGNGLFTGPGANPGSRLYSEQLGDVEHSILLTTQPSFKEGEWRVQPGEYFVMGDNRDSSNDSRYWGTVSEKHLAGKAFMVWMSFVWGEDFLWSRIGEQIK